MPGRLRPVRYPAAWRGVELAGQVTIAAVIQLPKVVKRLVVGQTRRSTELHETLLPKKLALPIFTSDPLSSVAYATQEILLVLTIGGLAYLWLTLWIAPAVVLLTVVVVVSYRQVVHACPHRGGSYEVDQFVAVARARKGQRRAGPLHARQPVTLQGPQPPTRSQLEARPGAWPVRFRKRPAARGRW